MRYVLPLALLAFAAMPGQAQWLNYIPQGTPLTADGKPDLSAPVPKVPDGKPDLSGVWHQQRTPPAPGAPRVESYANNLFRGVKPEDVPETELGKKIRLQRVPPGVKNTEPPDATSSLCLPMGIPATNFVNEVVKIIQTPTITMILYEVDGTYRQIHTDGRKLPVDPTPAWLGYSTGRWEGDTFVVETAGFNDKTWLDSAGHSHSDALHLTERYRRRDFGHMDIEMTFDDPKMYTRPFSIKFTDELQPATDILETYCNENEKDSSHYVGVK